MTHFDVADVRHFYERHTGSFIRFGQGGRASAIRRAVWGPGVHTRQQAFHYVDDQIAERVRRLPAASPMPHLVDLGCGMVDWLRLHRFPEAGLAAVARRNVATTG